MSNIYEQSSLCITPNAYKAGKLYSIVPTDGAGDLDVVRATSATYVGADGLIKTALANEPRLDYTNGSCPSILVEPQSTNLCLQSEMFTQSPWIGPVTISTNTDIAPDGTLTADTLTDSSTTQFQTRSQTLSVSGNSTLSVSVFIKKTIGTPTSYPGLTFLFTGVLARVARVILNTTTGSFNLEGVTTSNTSARVVSYNNYWRVELTATDNANNTSCQILISPAISLDGTTISSSATGSIVCWGAQLEVGSTATSYIPTEATTVTRNADNISKSGVSDLIGQTEGSIYVEFISNDGTNWNSGIVNLKNSTGSERFYIRYNSSPAQPSGGYLNFAIRANDVFVVILNAGTLIPIKGQRYKVCVTYNQTELKIFVNGELVATRTGSYTQPNLVDSIQLGGALVNGFISNTSINSTLIFKNVLSNAQAIQLTTL